MLRSLLKLALAGVLLFAAYKAAHTYYLFKLMDHFAACYPQSGACRLAERNAPMAEVEQALDGAMSCVRQRQGTVEALLHPVPDAPQHAGTAAGVGQEAASRSELLAMCRDLEKTASSRN